MIDQMHSLPVGQMGNYQEYLKRFTPPLREIESIPVRQHMFGNPFKIDKVRMVFKSVFQKCKNYIMIFEITLNGLKWFLKLLCIKTKKDLYFCTFSDAF